MTDYNLIKEQIKGFAETDETGLKEITEIIQKMMEKG